MRPSAVEYVINYLRELASAWLPATVLGGLSWLSTLFGMPHVGTALVLCLTILDWCEGFYLARLTRTFSYARAMKGLTKTMVWFGVLMVAAGLRTAPNEKILLAFSEWLVFGMVYLELLSVIKNARAIGTARTWDTSALAAIEQHISRFDPRGVFRSAAPPKPVSETPPTRYEVEGWTVRVVGDLDLDTARQLRVVAGDLIDVLPSPSQPGRQSVVRIDISETRYCDTSGLVALVGLVKQATERGHQTTAVEVYHPQENVSRVLHKTGFDKILHVVRVPGDKYRQP